MNVLSYGVSFVSVYPFRCLRGGLSWKICVLGAVGVVDAQVSVKGGCEGVLG